MTAVSNNRAMEIINLQDRATRQHDKVIMNIFSYLSAAGNGGLARGAEVSKRWKKLTSRDCLWNALDLRKVSPLLHVISGADWIAAFGAEKLDALGVSVDDEPCINQIHRPLISTLMRLVASNKIEGKGGVTILTNPRGLTHNILEKLDRSPAVSWFNHEFFSKEIGDIANEATYIVAITENVFDGSRNREFNEQKLLLSANGWEAPRVLEGESLLVMRKILSGERLLSDSPKTFTRCVEHDKGYPMVLGGFSPDGYFHIFSNCVIHNFHGIVGVLRIEGEKWGGV